jgi:hypothetical protein
MIAFECFRGPFHLEQIRVAPPYEVLGHLLSAYTSGALYDLIERGLREVQEGRLPEYETGQDAHLVRISKDTVHIEELEEYVGRAPLQCDVPVADFMEVLSAWRAHLGQR